jgi:hypothetical protein
MHRSSRVPCVVLAIAFFAAIGPASAQAQVSPPPFRPGEVLPDTSGVAVNAHGPGFLFDHDTYYWFGEVMTPGEQGNQPHVGVSCYSSKDLYYWKNLGVVLDQKHPVNDLTETSVVERPKVLFNRSTRQYVMWFHLEQTNHAIYGKAALVGVAVSKHPAGPYKYLRSFRPDGEESRDMTLFQDDDGKAYLVTASEGNHATHVSELDSTYLGTTGHWKAIFSGVQLEGQAIFKYLGKYYFVGSHCTGWAPNPAVSAVADSIWGPWTMLGNPARGPNEGLTFGAQSSYVIPFAGHPGAFIFVSDRWSPENPINGRYILLPIHFHEQGFTVDWTDQWDLSVFDQSERSKTASTLLEGPSE